MHEGLKEILMKKEGFYIAYASSEKLAKQNTLKMLGRCSKLGIPITAEMNKVFYNIEQLQNLNEIAHFVYSSKFLSRLINFHYEKVINLGMIGYVFGYYKNFYNEFIELFEKDDFNQSSVTEFVYKATNGMVTQKNMLIQNLDEVISINSIMHNEFINFASSISPIVNNSKRNISDVIASNNYFLEYILHQIVFIISKTY